MPNYTPTPVATGATVNPAAIQTELENIADAHNTHDTGDFPADSVPLSAIINDKSVFPLDIGVQGALNGPILANVEQNCLVIPIACTLIAVSAIALSITDGGDVNLYHETDAVDVLSADIEIRVALTAYTGTINKTDFAAGDVITIRTDILAADVITGLNFTLWFKSDHTT